MILALAATGIVIAALLGEVMLPRIEQAFQHHRARRRRIPQVAEFDVDPGRERRAEARARQLLKSCVNEEEWAMYRDLGFIRVWGLRAGRRPEPEPDAADAVERELDGRQARGDRGGRGARSGDEPYAYIVYPHKPILSYVPQTGRLLNEYCVEFPDQERPYGSARLPDSDDVLAKWMALTGDERRLIGSANMHLPGRQVDPRQVKRDLWRLRQWERERARSGGDQQQDSRVPAS